MDANSTGGLRPPMLWPLIAALLFFGGGHIGDHFVNPQTHVAYVWPATGVTIAVLSLVPIARWPMYLGAIGLAAVGVSLVFGESIGVSLMFAVVELVTSGVAAWGLQRLLGCPPRLDSLRGVAIFFFVGALGAAVLSATLGAAIVTRGQGVPFGTAWGLWVISNTVGTLVVAPAIISWAGFRPKRSGGLARRDFRLGLVFFTLLLLTLFSVFGNRVVEVFPEYVRLALTYLPEPFVVLTALAWGVRGGSLSLLALAAVSLHSMSHGDGHFISLQNGLEESIYELQLYLAITALMALLIAAMRSEQERALRESDAWRVRYEAASTAAGQVVFDIDPATGGIVWGQSVDAVLGQPAAKLATIDALTAHVDGAARARLRLMFDALRASESEAHAAVIMWPASHGAMQVEFVARAIADFDGAIYRIAGMARVIAAAER
jgi:integral membrane sensor domain MASE1